MLTSCANATLRALILFEVICRNRIRGYVGEQCVSARRAYRPYQMVYDYYAKWEAGGTTEALHSLLRNQVRVAKGRAATPTAAIIDSRSVKTSRNVSESRAARR